MPTNNIILVGVCGKARSGKDTFAEMLMEELSPLNVSTAVYSLATPIKTMLYTLLVDLAPPQPSPSTYQRYHAAWDYVWHNKERVIDSVGCSARHMLQTLGTDWGRDMISEDIWIQSLNSWVDRRRHVVEGNCVIIVPDVRFDNEAACMDFLIRVDRPDVEEVLEHKSEAGISQDYVRVVVKNNANLTALNRKASVVARQINEEFFNHATVDNMGDK